MTADSYSTQAAKIVGTSYEQLSSNESHGRLRICFFDYTVPTGGEADDNHLYVAKIPEGARLLGGKLVHDGLGNAVDIGLAGYDGSGYYDLAGTLADDDDLLAIASSVASPGTVEFNSTVYLGANTNFGMVLDKACWLVLTVETGAWTAGKKLSGVVYYAVD